MYNMSYSYTEDALCCLYCHPSTYFPKLQDYYVHENTKHTFCCWYAHCVTDFETKSARDQHLLEKHKAYSCIFCLDSFITKDALRKHEANPNRYSSKCKICEKKMGTSEMLWLHSYLNHKYQCPLGCESLVHLSFNDKIEFDDHLIFRHHLFPCHEDCDMVFEKEKNRAEHVKKYHPRLNSFSYLSLQQRETHM